MKLEIIFLCLKYCLSCWLKVKIGRKLIWILLQFGLYMVVGKFLSWKFSFLIFKTTITLLAIFVRKVWKKIIISLILSQLFFLFPLSPKSYFWGKKIIHFYAGIKWSTWSMWYSLDTWNSECGGECSQSSRFGGCWSDSVKSA